MEFKVKTNVSNTQELRNLIKEIKEIETEYTCECTLLEVITSSDLDFLECDKRPHDLEDRVYKLEKEKASQLGNLSQVEKIGNEIGNELIQMIDSE